MIDPLMFIALLPAVVLVVYICRKDRTDKEPPALLAKLLGFGALSCLPAIVVELILSAVIEQLHVRNVYLGYFLEAFVVAGLTEETCKFLFLRTTWRNPAFDYQFDAIVYAVMVALGFAAEREMRREGDPTSFAGVRRQVGRMLRFGVPSGAYTVLNILSFTIFVFVTGGVGELELAASNACFTVNYLLFAPMEGFSIGASTLVAQAIGRGDLAAARADARRTILLGVGLVAALSLVVVVCSGPILSIFASQAGERTEEFMRLGFVLLLIMAAWQVFDAADVIVSGALKGAGDTHFVMTWMLVTAFLFWLPLVFAVRHWHNTMPALWGTMVVYVVVICIGSFIRWRRGSWTLRFKGRFDTVPARVDSVGAQ